MVSVLPKGIYRFNVIHVKMPEGVRERERKKEKERERRLTDWQADSEI